MRFGILGDAKIAREKLLPAMRKGGHEIIHLAKRDISQPVDRSIWQDIKISSYEDMLKDPDVEAIYNPLPNHLHIDWTIKALEAGKPVLCEKPLALTLSDIDRLEAVCQRTGLFVYEGFMVRHHPQWDWIKNLDVGERQMVIAQFSYPPQPEGNVRNYADMGGGPVWDIGCYCLLAGLMLLGNDASLIASSIVPERHLDVEKTGSAIINFGNGKHLVFSVSSGASLSQLVRLVGSDGWAELDVPFNPSGSTTARWAHIDHTPDIRLSAGHIKKFEECDQYQLMVNDFEMACQNGKQADFSDSRLLTSILSKIVHDSK